MEPELDIPDDYSWVTAADQSPPKCSVEEIDPAELCKDLDDEEVPDGNSN